MSDTTLFTEKNIIKPEVIKAEIIITSAEIEQEREKYLKQVQKKISIPGFRPGKTPFSIIKKKYNNTAFHEGFEHLLKDKTNDILNKQTSKPLYYVYDFETSGVIQDDGTDKKIGIEFLLEPKIEIHLKDKEIELVKYGFTDTQRKIFSDVVILFNFLDKNLTDKLEDTSSMFIITSEIESKTLANSADEEKKKKAYMPLVIHTYQFQSYGLNELLPATIEKDKVYNADINKWIGILESNFSGKKLHLLDHLKNILAEGDTEAYVHIKEIQVYPNMAENINTERIKQVFQLADDAEINIDVLYNKLSEIIEIISEYFSGNENVRRGNEFIKNLMQTELPENFVQKLYDNYVKEEDKKYFSIELFKEEIIQQIENNILKSIFIHTFNPSVNYDEFATNVAKTYLVETLLTQMYLFDINSTKNYIIHTLQSSDKEKQQHLIQNYHNRDTVFSFAKNFEQDVKVNFKLENISKVNISDFIGVKKELFV